MTNDATKIDALLDHKSWHQERRKLRSIALDCGLTETVKWGKLCYHTDGANVAIFYGLNGYCALGFFKGALLKDPKHLLVAPGAHSQAMRQLRFADMAQILAQEDVLRAFILAAIETERSGADIAFDAKFNLVLPVELQAAFDEDADFAAAFDRLTPGRQRGWVLYFTGSTQAATRQRRIAGACAAILAGKGWNDR